MRIDHRLDDTGRGSLKYLGAKESVPLPRCPPQIPHELARYEIRAAATV
jgi:hypothetical protein